MARESREEGQRDWLIVKRLWLGLRERRRSMVRTIAVGAFVAFSAPIIGSAGELKQTMRDARGVACIVSDAIDEAPDRPDWDGLIIEVRAPATPPAAIVARLPASSRDFSTLPIQVFLVPSAERLMAGSGPIVRHVQPLSVDPTLVRPVINGVASSDLFIRVTYPRDALQAGVDIVAERTAVAADGEKVTSQTRCRIREADVAAWRE
jgi:hypothetical protein